MYLSLGRTHDHGICLIWSSSDSELHLELHQSYRISGSFCFHQLWIWLDGDVTIFTPVGEIPTMELLTAFIVSISLSYTNGFQVVSNSSFLHTIHIPTCHIYVKTQVSILDCFLFENIFFLSIGKVCARDLNMNLLLLVLHLHKVCRTRRFFCEQRVLNY